MSEAHNLQSLHSAMVEAVVTVVSEDGARAEVRSVRHAATRAVRVALPGYRCRVGDRVLVVDNDEGDAYLLGVLMASEPVAEARTVRTPDGATASVEGDEIALRDRSGQALVRYDARTGTLTLEAPQGDLRLVAREGRVAIEGAQGVSFSAKDAGVSVLPGHVTVRANKMDLHAAETRAKTERAEIDTTVFAGRAEKASWVVERYELQARKLIEKAQSVWRDVEGLAQTRVGRMRTLVREGLQMIADRTHIQSKQDTSIDGKRVLLG